MSLIARAVTRGAAPALARRAAPMLAPRARTFMSSIEDYGEHCFKGAVADKYLAKQGLPAGLLDDPSWTTSATTADSVAKAIMGMRTVCELFCCGTSRRTHGAAVHRSIAEVALLLLAGQLFA